MQSGGPNGPSEESREADAMKGRLTGNTLRVYVYALKNKQVGVREVQRALKMSNPSLAQYHLNKLKEMGLVSEVGGGYQVSNQVKVDVMRDFLRVGTVIVPRYVFYAVFFTVLGSFLSVEAYPLFGYAPIAGWLSAAILLSAAIFWYEAMRAWQSVPSL